MKMYTPDQLAEALEAFACGATTCIEPEMLRQAAAMLRGPVPDIGELPGLRDHTTAYVGANATKNTGRY